LVKSKKKFPKEKVKNFIQADHLRIILEQGPKIILLLKINLWFY